MSSPLLLVPELTPTRVFLSPLFWSPALIPKMVLELPTAGVSDGFSDVSPIPIIILLEPLLFLPARYPRKILASPSMFFIPVSYPRKTL